MLLLFSGGCPAAHQELLWWEFFGEFLKTQETEASYICIFTCAGLERCSSWVRSAESGASRFSKLKDIAIYLRFYIDNCSP